MFARAIILSVDDMEGMRQALSRMLTSLGGFGVLTAATNSEGLAAISRISFAGSDLDLITTDYNRPGGSGGDFIRAVRNLSDDVVVNRCLRARHIPIIVITGDITESGWHDISPHFSPNVT